MGRWPSGYGATFRFEQFTQFTTIRSSKERGCKFSRYEKIIADLRADLWIVDPHSAQNCYFAFLRFNKRQVYAYELWA